MKIFTWMSSLIIVGMLTGCGDNTEQTSMRSAELAISKMAAVQTALDQVIDARDAIKRADDDKTLALQYAEQKREAVKQAIALATKESEALKKDAAMRTRWAQTTHDQATETRQLLLKAALEQSDAKVVLAEKEKALLDMRKLYDTHQNDAKLATLGQLKADKLLAVVMEAEKIASLSIKLVSPNSKNVKNSNPVSKTSTKSKPMKVAKTANTNKLMKQHSRKSSSKATAKLASSTAANAKRGHGLAKKCQRCHNFEPNQENKFGPDLFGVVGQQAGKSQDYKYGTALAKANFSWDEEKLSQWICNSDKTIKQLTGNKYAITKMTTQKICGQDAKDVVAFLRTLKAQASAKSKTNS